MSTWIKIFTAINAFVFRKTKGRLGNKMGKQSVLLLHTVGRKSGKAYTTPLSFYRDGNNYLVVASNWGKENNPSWYQNLLQKSHTSIQVGSATIFVEARPAKGEEYPRLWELVTRQNEQYLKYQKELSRQIPIMVLIPTATT